MSNPLRLRPRIILAVILASVLAIFVMERAGGNLQSVHTTGGGVSDDRLREPIVGLPCEGCEAVFEGMPQVASLTSRARIAPPEQAGAPFRIAGTVFDGAGVPVPGVIVYAYHTDTGGIYPTDDRMRDMAAYRHGTLRGWAVTDGTGRYRFDTIRPGGYPDRDFPAHIHMHVIEPERCTYYIDDIMFERDPHLTAASRTQLTGGRGGIGIVMLSQGIDGMVSVARDIVLGERIPGYPDSAGMERAATNSAAALYERARVLTLALELESAIHALRASFAAGLETPMQAVADSRLSSLIADAEMRPLLRDALRDNAREHDVTMTSRDEPGDSFVLRGVVFDERTGEPIAGARVELVHADATGLYSMQEASWNPRLFAYLHTAPDGSFRVRTVRPGAYKDDDGNDVPSHVHFSITADGYRPFDSETPLDDDPLLVGAVRVEAVEQGHPLTHVQAGNGVVTGAVRIPLQPIAAGN